MSGVRLRGKQATGLCVRWPEVVSADWGGGRTAQVARDLGGGEVVGPTPAPALNNSAWSKLDQGSEY